MCCYDKGQLNSKLTCSVYQLCFVVRDFNDLSMNAYTVQLLKYDLRMKYVEPLLHPGKRIEHYAYDCSEYVIDQGGQNG